ncbi:MAG: tetratricopeptide repeat protein [Bryobacteraceae bacterium]|nr:tetratricopeptide repeat protein [Bryobacteraceae bacterium]MDW8380131.1 tetratricopeptide repeat protein [Bryobacterales bacterium]
MKSRCFACYHTGLALALASFGLFAQLVLGQESPPPGGGGAPGGGPTPGGSTTGGTPGGLGNPGGFPGSGPGRPGQQLPTPMDPRQDQQNRFPDMQRPIFLSGKVVMEDGTPPPEPVTIERVCNGIHRPEAYTNSKGHFSFQLGQNQGIFNDASVSSAADFGDFTRNSPTNPGFGGLNRQITERELMGCELRASLPGYRSEVVNLSGRRFMDNPDVGTIILRRLGNVEGITFSITSAAAPKDAKKAFEKGRELARKQKFAEAQKEFEKAVQIYPKFANAWQDLGAVHEAQNRPEEARKAYLQALEADPKLVKPYLQMAWIAARENKWQECLEASDRALKLNPFDFPGAYFVNAVANLNLQKFDAAERSAREGLKMDKANRIPKMRHILGIALAQKQDFEGAKEHLKNYMAMLPADSPDIPTVKSQLAQIEKFASAEKPAENPPQQ